MMRREPLLILDHGVIGQGQLCPPARGCHALRCLVHIKLPTSNEDRTYLIRETCIEIYCTLDKLMHLIG